MNLILELLLPYLLPSLIGFLVGLLVTEYFGKNYTILLMVAGILLIGGTPLVIYLFFESNFNLPFWQKLMSWTPGFIAGNIVDLIFHPLFSKLLDS